MARLVVLLVFPVLVETGSFQGLFRRTTHKFDLKRNKTP